MSVSRGFQLICELLDTLEPCRLTSNTVYRVAMFMCFVLFSDQTATISLYRIN
jgi:hypothetical protein